MTNTAEQMSYFEWRWRIQFLYHFDVIMIAFGFIIVFHYVFICVVCLFCLNGCCVFVWQ